MSSVNDVNKCGISQRFALKFELLLTSTECEFERERERELERELEREVESELESELE